jgi:hypothetical protein
LSSSGLRVAGAGRDTDEATRPAVVQTANRSRVTVFSVGTRSSGIPSGWKAGGSDPGVAIAELRRSGAGLPTGQIAAAKQGGDIVVVSVHWGGNWGYQVTPEQVEMAHRFVDAGADVVHGHSSHHPRPVEVYRDRLILYGCGDLINDYEGIAGRDEYRDDLRLLYFATLESASGELTGLRMVPFQARRMRLEHAAGADAAWLAATLLSGVPSTLYALLSGRDVLEATRAVAAMFPLTGHVLADAALVHLSVSAFWALVLALLLPERHLLAWAVVASIAIGLLDLRVIAPLFFPEVAALEFWPQMADHMMWGLCFGGVLRFRR